jgi:tetratricopeptide (TPR) repeat protein
MTAYDHRDCAITGANPAALQSYERALAAFQGWRGGAEAHLAHALEAAPGFVMAHALQAWLQVCSRDPERVRSAAAILRRAAALPGNARERVHLAAIRSALDDDYEAAKARLGELLRREPLDAVALQVVHAIDYATGDLEGLDRRVGAVLPAWSPALPGYHAVLAMHAFGLGESGAHAAAEAAAHASLELEPHNPRAHHVMAHVFEMTGRVAEGEQWLARHAAQWSADSMVVTHGWWHLALFQLAQERAADALATYDRHVRDPRSTAVADLIDASALLWRIGLAGADPGPRWRELAAAWAPHIEDRFCSFNDLHAMLAFAGAGDTARVRRLEKVLAAVQSLPTRHARSTREIGLPACRGIAAYGRGDDARAIALLASLPERAHRFGGSHAQRDVLQLTLMAASARLRRPVHRPRRERLVALARQAVQRWQLLTGRARTGAAVTP